MDYKQAIQKMVMAKERRLIVNLDDLREYDREFCDGLVAFPPVPKACAFVIRLGADSESCKHLPSRLLKEPTAWQPAADQALKDCAINAGQEVLKRAIFYVGFRGSFGENHATPRTLRADKLGKMVCLEGIVTRCQSHPGRTRQALLTSLR